MRKYIISYCLMLLTTLFWAGAFIGGKIGVLELSPVSLTFLRLFFASIILLVVVLIRDRRILKIRFRDLGVITILALVGVVGYQILLYTALRYTSSCNASILVSFSPLITAGLAYYINKDKISKRTIFAIFLAIIGVMLTMCDWNYTILLNMAFNKGDLLMLVAAGCLGLYSIIVKNIIKHYTPLFITTYTLIVSTLILLPFSLREGLLYKIDDLSTETWSSVFYLAIFPSAIAYVIQQRSIKEIGPIKTEIFRNLIPVFSIMLSYVLLGEHISGLKIISSGIIIVAVYMNLKVKVSKPKTINERKVDRECSDKKETSVLKTVQRV